MRPVNKGKDFEKVAIGEMLTGVIEKVEYDQEHTFKGFQGKDDTIQLGIRFKFILDNYKYAHYSRWMKFSTAEKSNLFKKFVSKLVENAVPNMDFDFDIFNGMKVKTVWSEDNGYQNLDTIYPVGQKLIVSVAEEKTDHPDPEEEVAPF